MWVGGVADSQTRSKPLKTTPNHPKNRPFLPEFHLLFSQISQKPLGGWVNRFGTLGDIPKKVFFGRASQYCTAGKLYYATSADSGAAGFSSGTSWPSFSAMNFSRAAASLSTNKINYQVRQQGNKIIMNINSLKHLFPLYLTPSSFSAPLLKNFSVG